MPRRSPKPIKTPDLPEHLITEPSQMAMCLEHLAASPVIGFDTEFVGEDAYRPELCLVQIATPQQLFVIDPFTCGPLDDFWKLLHDPARTTVVHAGREDIRICFFQAGQPPANVFDVQLAAGLVGLVYPIGYAGLVHDLLGQRMSKGETLTDWRRRPLLPAQVRYAYDDVRYLLPAWKKLTDRMKRLKRTEWASEEFASAIRKATADEITAERWRKVKGIGGLDPRGLAIARELFAWRDRFAERVNRPARHLLRDDVLAEVARRGPSKFEDLASYRGVPRGEVEAILEAVGRAKALRQRSVARAGGPRQRPAARRAARRISSGWFWRTGVRGTSSPRISSLRGPTSRRSCGAAFTANRSRIFLSRAAGARPSY